MSTLSPRLEAIVGALPLAPGMRVLEIGGGRPDERPPGRCRRVRTPRRQVDRLIVRPDIADIEPLTSMTDPPGRIGGPALSLRLDQPDLASAE